MYSGGGTQYVDPGVAVRFLGSKNELCAVHQILQLSGFCADASPSPLSTSSPPTAVLCPSPFFLPVSGPSFFSTSSEAPSLPSFPCEHDITHTSPAAMSSSPMQLDTPSLSSPSLFRPEKPEASEGNADVALVTILSSLASIRHVNMVAIDCGRDRHRFPFPAYRRSQRPHRAEQPQQQPW
jgi:hypothetical protein